MSVVDNQVRMGEWLFRNRSFIPLLLAPQIAVALYSFTYLGESHELTEYCQVACLAISVLGMALRAYTVGFVPEGTSGRNTSQQRAATLNTTGIYSVVRHPLYLANYLVFLGIVLLFRSWSFLLIASCLYVLYYERIMAAEEAYLRRLFGEEFDSWAARTPAFLPNLRLWKPPALPFCWRTVVRREYTSPLLIASAFAIFDLAADSWVEHRLVFDVRWMAVLIASIALWLAFRTLKKRTRLLHVPGR